MNSREAYRKRSYVASELRREGYSFADIGQILRVSKDGARRLVARVRRIESEQQRAAVPAIH